MSHQQFHAQHQQWGELEAEGQAEAAWRKREDEELARQEIEQRSDEEFARSLEEQFPSLKSWPGKAPK